MGRPADIQTNHHHFEAQPLLWHKRNPRSNPRYKTALCKHWYESGGCQFGDKCVYAHGTNELRQLSANAPPLRRERKQTEGRRLAEVERAQNGAAEQRPSCCSPREPPQVHQPCTGLNPGLDPTTAIWAPAAEWRSSWQRLGQTGSKLEQDTAEQDTLGAQLAHFSDFSDCVPTAD